MQHFTGQSDYTRYSESSLLGDGPDGSDGTFVIPQYNPVARRRLSLGARMDPKRRRRLAQEMLDKIDDVVIDEEISVWPWHPFRTPCDEELKDRKRQAAIRVLRFETDGVKRLAAAEKLVELGGYRFDKTNTLELVRSPHHFAEHWERLEKSETSIERFRTEFEESGIRWKGDQPDWNELRQKLLKQGVVRVTELDALTLVDVRNVLPLLAAVQADPTPQVKVDEKKARPKTARWAKQGGGWVIEFAGKKTVLADSDGAFYLQQILARRDEHPISSAELHSLKKRGDVLRIDSKYVEDDAIDADYKRQLQDALKPLRIALEDAIELRQEEKAIEINKQMEVLTQTHKKAMGAFGRTRSLTRSGAKKTHDTVRRRVDSVRRALARAGLSELVKHLEPIRGKGGDWTYRPEQPVEWEFSAE